MLFFISELLIHENHSEIMIKMIIFYSVWQTAAAADGLDVSVQMKYHA